MTESQNMTLSKCRILLIGFALTVQALLGCSQDKPNVEIEETILLAAPEAQRELIQALERNGVRFRVGDSGDVVYALSDRSAIESVAADLREKYFPIDAVLFEPTSEAHFTEFARLLEQARVPMREITRDGKRLLVVSHEHRESADDLWRRALESTLNPTRNMNR